MLRKNLVIYKNSVASILIRLLSTFLGFLSAVILARALGAENYGIYTFVIALVTIISIPCQLGMPQLLIRESSKANALEKWPLLKGLWKWATNVTLIVSVLLATTIYFFIEFSGYNDKVYKEVILASLILIPLVSLGNLRGAALQGLNHVIVGQLPESIIRPTLIILFIGLSQYLYGQVLAEEAVKLHAFAAFIAFIFGAYILSKKTPTAVKKVSTPTYKSKEWMLAAIPLALVSSVQLINSQTDIIMLSMFGSAIDVGVYKVVSAVCTLVIFGFMAIQLVLAPQIASLYTKNEIKELQKIVQLASRVTFFCAVPVVIFLWAYGEWLLSFMFGDEYIDGYLCLMILCIGRVINATFGFAVTVANMSGNESTTLKAMGISSFINVILNYILIPKFGIEGAAFATVVTLCFWNFYMWYLVNKRLGINTFIF